MRAGITENYWSAMHEDKKMLWRFFIRTLATVVGFLMIKTEIHVVNMCIAVFAAYFPVLVIEGQRAYGKHSGKYQRFILRTVIFLGTWSVVLLGIFVFSQYAFVAAMQVVASMLKDVPHILKSEIALLVFIIVLTIALFKAVLNVFRDLELEKVMYDLPKKTLIKLLVCRRFQAKDEASFCIFEIGVMVVGYMYAYLLIESINLLFEIISVFK